MTDEINIDNSYSQMKSDHRHFKWDRIYMPNISGERSVLNALSKIKQVAVSIGVFVLICSKTDEKWKKIRK